MAERCPECHDDVHVTIPAMAETHCLACHDLGAGADIHNTAWESQKCHQDPKAAAPTISGHTDCKGCHTSHAPASAARATCVGCHEAQRDHQPASKVCRGCHTFKGY